MRRIFFVIMLGVVLVMTVGVFAATPRFSKTLRVGSRGSDVSMLQSLLRGVPDIYPDGEATGYFGKLTEAAVKRFQKKYELEQVGVVGPKTREKLNVLLAADIVPVIITPVAPVVAAPVVPVTPQTPVAPLVPADVSAPLIRLLAAGNIAKERVTISWATDEPSDARVEYTMNGVYDNAPVVDATFTKTHALRVTGLIPGVLYSFRVSSRDVTGNVATGDGGTFRTLVNDLSQSTPGNCVVADVQKNLRTIGFGDENIGVGYLKDRRPGAFSVDELRAHCRAEDFIALANNYCDINPGATIRKYFVSYQTPNEVADAIDFCPTCSAINCPLLR